ncbi:hypothetical protein BXZ70DRAFT_515852 [Cristinia sonorae]|uniref:DUF3533 domain-containing protein n=1 Tax=Cristinia sonorae TaxID=1940300 RepID=A0A8K0XT89_9AGAR|nr:hypothetical protein BXZ70DRAFT_515852 [Cristinia sonorae]
MATQEHGGKASADPAFADAEPSAISAESRCSLGQNDSQTEPKSKIAPGHEKVWEGEEQASQFVRPAVYGFFAPGFSAWRKEYMVFMARVTFMVILLMWATLPAFWGALADAPKLTGKLTTWFVDRDNSRVGHALWDGISNSSGGGPSLGWVAVDPSMAGTNDDIAAAIVGESAWMAVVVEANATSRLAFARENGDRSYDPTSAVTVYYAQARHEVAVGSYLLPIAQSTLKSVMTGWATSAAQRYFAQISPGSTVNATALQMLSVAPQTISPAIDYRMVNLRPYTTPAALAVTLVGNIFLIIFAFFTVMAHNHARIAIAPRLDLWSYCGVRIAVPLIMYLPLSLSFTLISLAFHLPFGGKYSFGTGFIVAWAYTYLGMMALGLSLESMITILRANFVPFFLFPLIVFNVAPVLLPDELQNPLFMYGQGFPVPNLSQAMRTIFFNTQHDPGRNAGVLFGWILLSTATLVLFTILMHRREQRALVIHHH